MAYSSQGDVITNVSTRADLYNTDGEIIPHHQKHVIQWRKNREIKKLIDMYEKFEKRFEKILKSDYSEDKKYDKYETLLFDFNIVDIDKWKTVISFPSAFINKIKREMFRIEFLRRQIVAESGLKNMLEIIEKDAT